MTTIRSNYVDEMAEAVMRQMDRRTESMRVDRRGLTLFRNGL